MKKTIHENPRIVVEVSDFTAWRRSKTNPADFEVDVERCESVIRQIKRHVDDVSRVSLKYDTKEVCEFCNDIWENVIDEEGCPLCCTKAMNEWESQNGKDKPLVPSESPLKMQEPTK